MNYIKGMDTLSLIDGIEAVPTVDIELINQFIHRMEWTMNRLNFPDDYYSGQYCKSLYELVESVHDVLTYQVDLLQELTERALADDEIMGWLRGSK